MAGRSPSSPPIPVRRRIKLASIALYNQRWTVPAKPLLPLLLAGAAPLDLNGETTLEAAGVANSMVVMKWDD